MRKEEYFTKLELQERTSISQVPPNLYKQDRDWTCAIACIRTLMSGIIENVPSEDYFIEKYKLKPGPLYSKNIKELKILNEYNVIYGCDNKSNFDDITNLLKQNYFIMLESMVNYSHWMVLLGYYVVGKNIEEYKLLFYDPYYNDLRLIRTDEFISMWRDGGSDILNDFIAIKNF